MHAPLKSFFLIGLFAASAPALADRITAQFDVDNMHCALCPITVRKAMEMVDGVVEVQVDFDSKIATVTFDDDKTSTAEIARASTDVGYPAQARVGEQKSI